MSKGLLSASLVLALLLLTPAPRTIAADRPYLAAATDTARWIRSTAVKTPQGTYWPATPGDAGPAAQGINPTLYSGTPGVVLFLLELHRASGRADDLQDARSGADHLLATLDDKPQSGLYTGVAGVGFVLGEVYKATNDARYRDGMRKSVEILQRTAVERGAGVEWTPVTDIISGTAGTGLYLLHAAKELNMPAARDLAVRAGRRLIELGQADKGGTTWPMSPGMARMMPNFSHGTGQCCGSAGVAEFFLHLHTLTGLKEYLAFSERMTGQLLAAGTRDAKGLYWVHAEHRVRPKDVFAQTGWMQGAAGIGAWLLRLDAHQQNRPSPMRFPDLPF